MAFVSYVDMGGGSGAPVNEEDFDPEDWQYHLDHGNIVLAGSDKDPNVIEARKAGIAYEDPRDQRIAELEAALAAINGPQTPAPGSIQQATAQGASETEEEDPANPVTDPATLQAQQTVDQQQAAGGSQPGTPSAGK